MIDFITAIMGGKHCGWCTDKPPTWLDRKMRFDQPMKREDRRLIELFVEWLHDVAYNTKVWVLGQKWHQHFHPDPYANLPSACDTCPACQEALDG